MSGDARFTEDLPRLAAESFALADHLCGSCRNFHMVWPYNRLAQAGRRELDVPLVQSVLRRLLSQDEHRILIAGCADSGLLALVARSAGLETGITVLDRCETPLELCRRFADRWSLQSKFIHLDLQRLSITSAFDVVFVHMLLQFFPAGSHLDILSRLRRSLRPGGRLVLVFRTSPCTGESLTTDYRPDYPRRLIEQLEARNIPLPESREDFRRRLEVYFEDRRVREGSHANRAEVETLIKTAGFEIEELAPIVAPMSAPFVQVGGNIGL